jgi:hypothetical protein
MKKDDKIKALKIKVLKQEVRGIRKTIIKYNPNPKGLRKFNRGLRIREGELAKLGVLQ